jgi:hypothetical protein
MFDFSIMWVSVAARRKPGEYTRDVPLHVIGLVLLLRRALVVLAPVNGFNWIVEDLFSF